MADYQNKKSRNQSKKDQYKRAIKKRVLNQRGSLTVEMIFGLITAIGVGVVLFAVSFSFTTIEIAQYIAFSSARAQASASKNLQAQVDRGLEKYTALKGSIFSSTADEWFEFSSVSNAYSWSSTWSTKFPTDNVLEIGGGQTFPWAPNKGFGFNVTLKLLGVKLPVLGSAGDKDSFKTFVSALVLRQPTHEDCTEFWGPNRGKALEGIDVGRFGNIAGVTPSTVYSVGGIADMMKENACGPNPL